MSRTSHMRNERIREANLAVLEQRYSGIRAYLSAVGSPWGYTAEVGTARSDVPTLLLAGQGARIQIHSAYDPKAEARRWAEAVPEGGWRTAIVFGCGLGYHIEELVRRFSGRRFIVLEPDPAVFQAAIATRDLRSLLANSALDFAVGPDKGNVVLQVYGLLSRDLTAEPALLAWPATQRLYGRFWQEVQQGVADSLRQKLVNVATTSAFSLQWLVNFFVNLPVAVGDPGIRPLVSTFAGRPAILVAAGPSLEKNIDLLPQAKGRALIVAAGSAIQPLLKRGIVPDLVLSIDPGEVNYRIFSGVREAGLPLIYSPTVHHQIVQEYLGPRFTMGLDVFPFIDWSFRTVGETKGEAASGPSVANTGWDLLRQMGCDPIIFVGQDLAYTNNKTHAEGQLNARTLPHENTDENIFYIEDIYGQQVLTSRAMYAMKTWFDQRIAQHGRAIRNIDATEGGARIEGTEVMTLRAALDLSISDAFEPLGTIMDIHGRERARLEAEPLRERLGSLLTDLDRELNEMEEIYQQTLEVALPLVQAGPSRSLTMQKYQEATRHFRELDQRATALTVYRLFLLPTLTHVVESLNALSTPRVQEERDLTRKAGRVATTYLTFFTAAREKAAQMRALVRLHDAEG